MIKLTRPPAPEELTEEKIAELTEEFKRSGKRVWAENYIKEALLAISNNKCCYCECRLEVNSEYMEIEHFHPKSKYPDRVVMWDNLLPCCKRCNSSKSDHDTYKEPVINPAEINPKDHLRLEDYRYKPKTPLGEKTIEVVYLNDTDRLGKERWKTGEAVQNSIEDLLALAIEYESSKSARTRNRVTRGLKQIQEDCLPSSQYCATAGSILLKDKNYYKLKEILIKYSLWDDELKDNEAIVKEYAFDN